MQAQENNHTIHVVTLEAEADQGGGAAYNYILFRNGDAADAIALHALPLRRKDNTLTLRAIKDQPSKSTLNLSHMQQVDEICIFRGNGAEYLKKMVCALDAMKWLNEQNINYRPNAENNDTPNSITHSLIAAMELECPEDATRHWVAGFEHHLLPKDWSSHYAT